jgi:integrase
MEYLGKFDGPTGRHRLNQQDILNMLYEHATRHFGLAQNPVAGLERPLITHQPVKTLTLTQVLDFFGIRLSLAEEVACDLSVGHGWREVEIRRIQAIDVWAIANHLILCHGKEREEMAPILPETEERLRRMAEGLAPGDFLFRAKRARHGQRAPLGEDGMRDWLEDIFTRAGITGFLPHDLRRTFATLVTAASNDEFLAMRLIRDKVPGLSDRYVNYPLAQLVAALEKYSPQRQATKLVPPPTRGNPGPGAGDAVPAAAETKQPRAVIPPEAGNKSGRDGVGSISI